MNVLVTVIQSGQNVKECECIYQPVVDAIGITLPNGYNILMPAMGADPSRVFFHTKDMLIRSGIARQEAGATGRSLPSILTGCYGSQWKTVLKSQKISLRMSEIRESLNSQAEEGN